MAGSLKWFVYTANDANDFAILADESNIEGVNGTNATIISPTVKYKIPGNLKPRTATFQSVDGLIRREIVVLNAAAEAALTGTSTITDQSSGETLFLRSLKGEQVLLPNLADTGLLDGDAD